MHPVKYAWALRALLYKPFIKIGNYSYLGKPLLILGRKRIAMGDKVRILPGLRAEVHGDQGMIKIGSNISIGQNFHVTAGGLLEIRDGTAIAGNVCVTSLDHEYRDCNLPVTDQPHINSTTVIGENCFIGYGVVIQSGTQLGKHCVVGANSVVRGVFPDYSVLVGAPARVIKNFNTES